MNDPSPSCISCTTRESGDDEEEQSDDHDPRQGVDKLAWVNVDASQFRGANVASQFWGNVDASQFRPELNCEPAPRAARDCNSDD